MNTPSTNLTILHDAKEWNTDIEGEIGEIRVDGKRLSDVHDLAVKVEGIAQSIRTLVICLGAIVMICLICNVGLATWVATNDDEITDVIQSTISRNSRTMDTMNRLNHIYTQKLETLGLRYRNGKWQQFGNSPLNPS